MAEQRSSIQSVRRIRHRQRLDQIPIYLGKLLRGFLFLNDWKVFSMAAIIAALVSMVVRRDYFLTMEGTLKGSFAMTCVAIWNGCFNSIQVVCRERQIIKREHRSGMHISSYIFSHMVYQALLCAGQTAVMLFVCARCGIKFPTEGYMTSWMMLDLGITLFLISYTSDMLSLLVSSIARSTTSAMTVMPFILIFQLVFSGGVFSLPAWTQPVSRFTISNYGLKCMAAVADYNNQPMVTAWQTLSKLEEEEISGTVTVRGIFEVMENNADKISAAVAQSGIEVEDDVRAMIGGIVGIFKEDEQILGDPDKPYEFRILLGDLYDLAGRDNLKTFIDTRAASAGHIDDYERSKDLIATYWFTLFLFALLYAVLATVSLEFIDKDHR